MIKNIGQLLKNLAPELRKRRRILLEIADYTVENLVPQKLLAANFPKNKLDGFKRIVIISIGKAAKNLVEAVTPLLGKKPDEILIADHGHPLPTLQSVAATKKIIKTARSLGEKDLAIVLISGGGSAMFTCPVPEISLKDKIKTTKTLLKSGATINEMNVVRKHLSQIKGGRLAALLYPATVIGFVISDVVGNDLSTISSGPISPDKSTFKDALKIIKKYMIKMPKKVLGYLEKGLTDAKAETPKPGEKYFDKVSVKIIADHKTALKTAAEKARQLGLKVKIMPKLVTGEARDAAKKLLSPAIGFRCAPGCPAIRRDVVDKSALASLVRIASGETTVTCRENGAGGRNQEFVLAALKHLKTGQTVLSIGTDGIDGITPKPVAGAIADSHTISKLRRKHLDIDKFLKKNDSYTFFKRIGGHIITGPTGTNVGDLIIMM